MASGVWERCRESRVWERAGDGESGGKEGTAKRFGKSELGLSKRRRASGGVGVSRRGGKRGVPRLGRRERGLPGDLGR